MSTCLLTSDLINSVHLVPQNGTTSGFAPRSASIAPLALPCTAAELRTMSFARVLFAFGLSLVVAEESPSLRGAPSTYSTKVACSGTGGFSSDKPVCYGGNILFQSYTLEITNFDGSDGVVNMHADGAVSGKCDGAQFQSSDNMITIENDNGCGIGAMGLEYKVMYCPDQDHVIVNVMKPFDARVVLKSQTCPDAGEV